VNKVRFGEVLDLAQYEQLREGFRAHLIELKRPRRIAVGDRTSFLFENRATVLFQIQEMLRAERVAKQERVQEEIDVYNELIPGPFELSATLMIEIEAKEKIRGELDRLKGIDEHVFLDVGDAAIPASFDRKQFDEERISAVQYVKFPLGPLQARRFADPSVRVVLRVEHPNYRAATAIEGASRASLAADLAE
jgi:hypothetical protein